MVSITHTPLPELFGFLTIYLILMTMIKDVTIQFITILLIFSLLLYFYKGLIAILKIHLGADHEILPPSYQKED